LALDHKLLLGALDVLSAIAKQAQRGQSVNHNDVGIVLEFLNGFGDRHHQGEEEDVLFPALLERAASDYPELGALVFEHNRQRSIIDGIQESLLTKNDADFVYFAQRLNETLRSHIVAEEEKLFPMIERALPPADDERVAAEMQRFDKAWQVSKLAEQLRSLAEMELKYLARA